MDQLIVSLYFQYVDLSRRDPFFKSKHVNVIKVPRSSKIIIVPKTTPSIKNNKLTM
ncbi:hypothetical protein R3W88_007780 [Solanum pinnatisectum]|uniref:Uncharacterized protein n=1 Tax=Solanum pinnatisectum TaxID=50273 RepID=A0AAV9M9D3_9SOLN|nr:hypothetical protein R3W88_007780 [Solanum pinnatisectum]